jgi:OmcA/MtrC family decaheme c-type cytochrome
VIKGVDGATTVRRSIVDMQSCDTCHERIGFHSNAGRANNAEYCATCHNPEITSSNLFVGFANYPVATPPKLTYFSQRPNNFKDMVHAIHAGEMRKEQNPDDPFNFLRGNPLGTGGAGPMIFENVVYPARQYDCQTCHKSGTYGLKADANLAWSAVDATAALGTANTNAGQTGAAAGVYDPLKTVRIGPAQAACGSCHNSAAAKSHFVANTVPVTGESCTICHGSGAAYEAHK